MLNSRSHSTAIIFLIIANVLWGSGFAFIKIELSFVNAYGFVFLRLGITGVLLLCLFVLRRGFRLGLLKRREVWILGSLNGAGFSFQNLGLSLTTAAKTALLTDMNVLIVALLSWKLFHETLGFRKQFGIVVGIAGAVLITTNGDLAMLAGGQTAGDLIVLLGSVAYAFFFVLSRRMLMRVEQDAFEMAAMVMISTTFFTLPTAILFGNLTAFRLTGQALPLLLFVALACTLLPFILWATALKTATATVATLLGLLEILTAMTLSTLLLGETYSTITLIGACLILASLLLTVVER